MKSFIVSFVLVVFVAIISAASINLSSSEEEIANEDLETRLTDVSALPLNVSLYFGTVGNLANVNISGVITALSSGEASVKKADISLQKKILTVDLTVPNLNIEGTHETIALLGAQKMNAKGKFAMLMSVSTKLEMRLEFLPNITITSQRIISVSATSGKSSFEGFENSAIEARFAREFTYGLIKWIPLNLDLINRKVYEVMVALAPKKSATTTTTAPAA